MAYKTCENCGSRVFNHGCVNCDEMEYISMQEGYTETKEIMNDEQGIEKDKGNGVLPCVSGSLPLFKCKCGYETSNIVAWGVHADCCNGNDR